VPQFRKRNPNRTFTFGLIAVLALVIGYAVYNRTSNSTSSELIGLRELPPSFKSHGIDISRYKGDIDWPTFFDQAKISFVYCKATEGLSHVDAKYTSNRNKLRENNKAFGVYHFFRPKSDAETQAKHFLSNYKPRGNELPPVLDVETESVSDAKLIKGMKVWLELVEKKTGKRPVIYTSYHFYNTKFKNHFKNYQFWIANYSRRNDRMTDDRIIHWQYSDRGGIPGIEGPVDLNFSKQEFN
jgi:lysozyme